MSPPESYRFFLLFFVPTWLCVPRPVNWRGKLGSLITNGSLQYCWCLSEKIWIDRISYNLPSASSTHWATRWYILARHGNNTFSTHNCPPKQRFFPLYPIHCALLPCNPDRLLVVVIIVWSTYTNSGGERIIESDVDIDITHNRIHWNHRHRPSLSNCQDRLSRLSIHLSLPVSPRGSVRCRHCR